MKKFEKLANLFLGLAARADTARIENGSQPRLLLPVADIFYAMAGAFNGTRDYRTARIHHTLKTEWEENVKRQTKAIRAKGSGNNQMMSDMIALDSLLEPFKSILKKDPLEVEVAAYLASKLDEEMKTGRVTRLDAMRHLMRLDLTDTQHKLAIVKGAQPK